MSDFHGVLPALITPFTEDGSAIDTDALGAFVERLIDAGVGGLVPGGSTGEFTTLTNAERRQLTEVTVEAAAGRVPVVAGTGALSTRETVELSVHAEQAGAAAVMIIPPFYDAPVVARAAGALHGGRGRDLDPDHVLQHARRLGRDADRRAAAPSFRSPASRTRAATPRPRTELIQTDGPTLLNGYDTHTFHALAAGVEAVVWGTASIIPEQCVELHRLLIDDIDLPAARELWARIWPLCQFLESDELLRRRQGRLPRRRRHHRAGPRAAARARRRRGERAGRAGRARDRRAGRAMSTATLLEFRNLVGGELVDAVDGGTREILNPADGRGHRRACPRARRPTSSAR